MHRLSFISLCSMALAAAVALSPAPAVENERRSIRIGVLASVFRGETDPTVRAAIKKPVESVLESQTGFDCQLEVAVSHNDLRKKLGDGRLHFGLCHGFDLAWMQLIEPQLKPLMIAVPDHQPLKALVVVTRDSPVKELCDLADKVVAVPKGSDAVVGLFVKRQCRCSDQSLARLAGSITKPVNAETALHQLYEEKLQAAVIDGAGLRAFKERYPARSRYIRVLVESEPFPLGAVVYQENVMDPAVVQQFREAMRKADASPMIRHLMALLHSRGFEDVPADYQKQLRDFAQQYPPPLAISHVIGAITR
jgi:ABC-type phosphate/phosphonate transport system substrate-binding protein